jgi:prepilin-type N-terminal cleavage/methylation domain-containing protein
VTISMPKLNKYRSAGFTLVEMSAVILLMGLLCGVATLTFRGPYQAACFEYSLQQIEQFDATLRQHARRFGRPAELTIDITQHRFTITADESRSEARQFQLRPDVKIAAVRTAGLQSTYGTIAIGVSRNGSTPSYALHLVSTQGAERWIVVLGLVGQVLHVDDEQEVQALLSPEGGPNLD